MKQNFKICGEKDIRLVPYSPVQETDNLEIRCQIYNESTEAEEVKLSFCFDGVEINRQTLFVESKSYGLAVCRHSMKGKAGRHKISVNGELVDLEVVKKSPTLLNGGFIMFGPPNDRDGCDLFRDDLKNMTDSDWENYVDELSKMGADCVIITACAQYLCFMPESGEDYKIVAHYPSKIYPKSDIVADDPIDAVLRTAEKNGMKVFIAVGNNYGHAGTIEELCELFERYNKYKSFYGWYFSLELNMESFSEEQWNRLAELTKAARRLSPVMPILTSPYRLPSEEFLEYVRRNDIFDIIMPQDWVGQKRLTLSESDMMHRRLLESAESVGKHLWGNCESFNFSSVFNKGVDNGGHLVPRFRDGGMDGEAGFIQQMQTVRPYVEKIMNFMFSGFFTPTGFVPKIGGEAAVKQYEDYMKYYKEQTKNN